MVSPSTARETKNASESVETSAPFSMPTDGASATLTPSFPGNSVMGAVSRLIEAEGTVAGADRRPARTARKSSSKAAPYFAMRGSRFMGWPTGFEPVMRVPQTLVLPLHHGHHQPLFYTRVP